MTEKKRGMSIRKKLLFSYFSIVALILVIGIVGIYNVRKVYYNSNEIYVNNLNSVEYLKSINQNIKEIDQSVISMMSSLDQDYHEEYMTKIANLQKDNQALMQKYSELKVTDLEKRRYNQCRFSILTFNKRITSIVEKLNSNDKEAALIAYEQELMPVKACTYELAEAVVELSTANAQSKNEDNRRIHQNLVLIIGGIMGLSVIVAIVITIGMSNYFTNGLAEIQRLAKRISEYNVADDIQNMADDEFGQTVEALNDSQFMMRDLLEKIIDESTAISDTGEEISLAIRKSGQRIEHVNVQMLNSGDRTEQVDTTVKQILENRSLDSDTVKLLNTVLEKFNRERINLSKARAELSSIAMYLEQIAITSDYQNEIADSHKEQLKKFKV